MSPLFPPQAYRKTEFTHRIGLASARPNATDVLVGTLYFSTDTLVLERSNGTTWDSYTGSGSSGNNNPTYLGLMGESGEPGEQGMPGPINSDVALKSQNNAFTGSNSFATNPVNLLVGQILFPSTQNPSSNANTLDDYEEGTWTPSITAPAGTVTSYSQQIGRYVKVGLEVYVSGFVQINVLGGTLAGAITIAGLPFTIENLASFPTNAMNWSGLVTNWVIISGIANLNTNTLLVRGANAAATTSNTNVVATDLANTCLFTLNIFYRATA